MNKFRELLFGITGGIKLLVFVMFFIFTSYFYAYVSMCTGSSIPINSGCSTTTFQWLIQWSAYLLVIGLSIMSWKLSQFPVWIYDRISGKTTVSQI